MLRNYICHQAKVFFLQIFMIRILNFVGFKPMFIKKTRICVDSEESEEDISVQSHRFDPTGIYFGQLFQSS